MGHEHMGLEAAGQADDLGQGQALDPGPSWGGDPDGAVDCLGVKFGRLGHVLAESLDLAVQALGDGFELFTAGDAVTDVGDLAVGRGAFAEWHSIYMGPHIDHVVLKI